MHTTAVHSQWEKDSTQPYKAAAWLSRTGTKRM